MTYTFNQENGIISTMRVVVGISSLSLTLMGPQVSADREIGKITLTDCEVRQERNSEGIVSVEIGAGTVIGQAPLYTDSPSGRVKRYFTMMGPRTIGSNSASASTRLYIVSLT